MFAVALLRVEEHSFWKQGKGQTKKDFNYLQQLITPRRQFNVGIRANFYAVKCQKSLKRYLLKLWIKILNILVNKITATRNLESSRFKNRVQLFRKW